jgi:ATP-binding cassette subfamily C protein LapB
MEAALEKLKPVATPPAVLEPPGEREDPLLSCLVIMTRLFGAPKSATALAAGLPVGKEGFSPELFVRSAERVGLAANLVRRPFNAITPLSLPCVLLLKDRQACVFLRRVDAGTAEIATPDNLDGTQSIALAELAALYDGRLIVVRPKIRMDSRSFDLAEPRPKSWFWGSVFSFAPVYLEVILAAAILNVFGIATPIFTMTVYDRVVPNQALDTLWVLVIGIGATFFFDFLMRNLRGYFLDRAGKQLDRKISARIFEQILTIKMAAGPASSGAFASNIREFETLRDFFTSASLAAIVDLPFLFLFLLVIWYIGGPVVVVPAVVIPLVILVSIFVQIPMRKAVERSYRETAQKHATLVETINLLDSIKAASAEGSRQRDWNGYVAASAASAMASRFWSSISINFTMLATNIATVGCLVWGVYRAGEGLMTTGAMVAVSMLAGRAMAPLAQIAALIVRFQQSWMSLKGLNRLMELPTERPVGKEFLRRPNVEGAIEFRNVKFKYPGQEGLALDGVSFKINPGERVGIVGRIGSGKTTIERLVVGLYEPDDGAVLIDGTDIRQVDPADLRRSVGCVLQDGSLIFGSVKDNITLGAPFVEESGVIRAATIAGVDQFIKGHPLGYDLPVGEGGRMLSGGQRQAVIIARSLLMDPPILVMDEPTSSMDNSTETAFKNRLSEILPGKTFMLVTHRNSMLTLVDRLIVIDGGKVMADGPKTTVLEALVKGRIAAAKA